MNASDLYQSALRAQQNTQETVDEEVARLIRWMQHDIAAKGQTEGYAGPVSYYARERLKSMGYGFTADEFRGWHMDCHSGDVEFWRDARYAIIGVIILFVVVFSFS